MLFAPLPVFFLLFRLAKPLVVANSYANCRKNININLILLLKIHNIYQHWLERMKEDGEK